MHYGTMLGTGPLNPTSAPEQQERHNDCGRQNCLPRAFVQNRANARAGRPVFPENSLGFAQRQQ
eukprot:3339102-Lingulodinium_polyedra.AAC.1